MESMLDYQSDNHKDLINKFFKYIQLDHAFFTYGQDIIDVMEKNSSNYFRVPARHTKIGRELYFYFDVVYSGNKKIYQFDRMEIK